MTKYIIIKDCDQDAWMAYEVVCGTWNELTYIKDSCSLKGLEDCEQKLRDLLVKRKKIVWKELEVK